MSRRCVSPGIGHADPTCGKDSPDRIRLHIVRPNERYREVEARASRQNVTLAWRTETRADRTPRRIGLFGLLVCVIVRLPEHPGFFPIQTAGSENPKTRRTSAALVRPFSTACTALCHRVIIPDSTASFSSRPASVRERIARPKSPRSGTRSSAKAIRPT